MALCRCLSRQAQPKRCLVATALAPTNHPRVAASRSRFRSPGCFVGIQAWPLGLRRGHDPPRSGSVRLLVPTHHRFSSGCRPSWPANGHFVPSHSARTNAVGRSAIHKTPFARPVAERPAFLVFRLAPVEPWFGLCRFAKRVCRPSPTNHQCPETCSAWQGSGSNRVSGHFWHPPSRRRLTKQGPASDWPPAHRRAPRPQGGLLRGHRGAGVPPLKPPPSSGALPRVLAASAVSSGIHWPLWPC